MKLDRFLVEDVRCFKGPQEVRIRPLTFLVGENSTGKTTVLGCMQALADYMYGAHATMDFNRHPYEMGSFREIVRKSKPLLKSFKIGATFADARGCPVTYLAELGQRQGRARADIKNVIWRFGDAGIILSRDLSRPYAGRRRLQPIVNSDRFLEVSIPEPVFSRIQARPWLLPSWLDDHVEERRFVEKLHPYFRRRDTRVFGRFADLPPAGSIAPVRSRPERTYNPFSDTPDAEGTDIPAELASIARRGGKRWTDLKKQLEDFGRETGLFAEIVVRRLGKSGIDPFQLQVKVRGPKANLKDVGYGVSQALPILVHLAQSQATRTSLIQQPEVHLHPRAQAVLSSILIGVLGNNRLGRQRPSRFVIETHSDYMLDRARIEIRKGRIDPEDVSLVYCEPRYRKGTIVHNITFDDMGNMIGAPDTYREFFLRETNAFLGFDE